MKKIISSNIVLLFLAFLLSSCQNFLGSDSSSSGLYTISGTIETSNVVVEGRTAFPGSPENLSYEVYAYNSSTNENVYATVTVNKYEIKLKAGSYSIKGTLYSGEGDDKKTLMTYKSSGTQNITSANPCIIHNITFKPSQTTGQNGSVDLDINFPADAGITTIGFAWKSISGTTEEYKVPVDSDADTVNFTFNNSSVPSSSYDVTISFYKGTGEDLEPLYICTQLVNVYDNMHTDHWVKNGNEEYLDKNDITGAVTFVLTNDIINKFKTSTYYVASAEDGGADSNRGSWISPFNTITAALSRINGDSGSGPYNIFVKDGYRFKINAAEITTGESQYLSPTKNVNIESYKTLPGDKAGTATLLNNTDKRVLSVNAGVEAVISGLVFSGAEGAASCPGIKNEGSLTVENCKFKACNVSADENGSAIFHNGTSLVIKGSTWCDSVSDIYLCNDKCINVNSTLSPQDMDGNAVSVSGIKVTLATTELNKTTILKSSSELTWNVCNNFQILNTPDSGAYCVKPDGTEGKLAVKGYGVKPVYNASVIDVSLNKTGGIAGFDNEITYEIKNPASINLNDYTFAIYQNGCFVKNLETSDNKFTFPSWLKGDDYKILFTANWNGMKIDKTFDYKNAAAVPLSSVSGVPVQDVYCETVDDLEKLKDLVNNGNGLNGITVYLINDVDFNNKEFKGIGTYISSTTTYYFNGTFDGLGNKLLNVKIKNSSAGFVGVFSYIKDAKILNLTVTGSGEGGIASAVRGTCLIKNCISNLDIERNGDVAGIVGTVYDNTIIEECINYGTIKYIGSNQTSSHYGGICYYLGGGSIIRNCINYGTVTSNNNNVAYKAGIVGRLSEGTVENCLNTGSIEKGYYTAGIAGKASYYTGVLNNNVTYGELSGYTINGIIAENDNHGSNTLSNNFYKEGPSNSNTGCYSYNPSTNQIQASKTTGSYEGTDIVEHLNAWIDSQTEPGLYKHWKYDETTGKPVFAE